jgi:CBS domain containing-hemolysin-like protein
VGISKGSKGMETMVIFSIVLFLSLLAFFSAQLFLSTTSPYNAFTNQSNNGTNIVTIGQDYNTIQLCDIHIDIPILGGLIWGADCIADYTGFLFGFATTTTGINWLTPIIIAMVGVLIYIGIRLIRGKN